MELYIDTYHKYYKHEERYIRTPVQQMLPTENLKKHLANSPEECENMMAHFAEQIADLRSSNSRIVQSIIATNRLPPDVPLEVYRNNLIMHYDNCFYAYWECLFNLTFSLN